MNRTPRHRRRAGLSVCLLTLATLVGLGGELLRPGHHTHLEDGGLHHHHVFMGSHSHGSEDAEGSPWTRLGRSALRWVAEGPTDHHTLDLAPQRQPRLARHHDGEVEVAQDGSSEPLPASDDDGGLIAEFPLQPPQAVFSLAVDFAALTAAPARANDFALGAPAFDIGLPRGPPLAQYV